MKLFYLGLSNVPGQPTPLWGFGQNKLLESLPATKAGKLAEIEAPHLGQIFAKCMS